MDLNMPMTLDEWDQVPPLPGLEEVAENFRSRWEDLRIEKKSIFYKNIIDKTMRM